jgi:putative methionine-R-sulfoxide reductase with GAF domain
MDKYTIFDQAGPGTGVAPARDVESLPDPARRDLEAALQLLAERAQYLTGASGAAIALCEGGEMVCRASAGRAAPELGVEIETDSGLTAESIRTHQFVRCDDADSDPRVNRESCRELGVKSVMVMPLVRDQDVAGVFELVADRASAFEERDVASVTRIAEMALTAVEHAEATRRVLPEIAEAKIAEPSLEEHSDDVELLEPRPEEQKLPSSPSEPAASVSAEVAQIGSCQRCGFPVSHGRTLCVDCERVEQPAEKRPPLTMDREETWWQAHGYTLGALLIAALTLALLALKLR